ncbi:hypothetical protein [Thiocapsa sp.]|nr:hypothetical protein [Thiocapsa sp.]HSO84895.1 hypothetical protein [Thiocapsa sp.]
MNARELGLPETAFPRTCPYALEQILTPDFFARERPTLIRRGGFAV